MACCVLRFVSPFLQGVLDYHCSYCFLPLLNSVLLATRVVSTTDGPLEHLQHSVFLVVLSELQRQKGETEEQPQTVIFQEESHNGR